MPHHTDKSPVVSRRFISKAPTLLLVIGVISLIGTLGAPGLASASGTARTGTSVVRHAALHSRTSLRPSLFNAGRVKAGQSMAPPQSSVGHLAASPTTTTPTLYVNASTGVNTGSCRLQTNPCLTITYAISVAPSAAIIDVAAGTYAEQVVDSAQKKLSIVGAGEGTTIIEPSTLTTTDTDTDGGSTIYAIVDAQPGSKVKLQGLTIDGQAATNQFSSCANDFVGVYYHDAKGKMTNVAVKNIVLPQADFGCQQGLAVYAASDATKTTKVTMDSVTVTNYDKNGITCDDAGTTCKINNSTVTGIGATGLTASNGIQGFDAKSIQLTNDTVTANTYTGTTYVSTGVLFYDDLASSATSVVANSDDVGIYDVNDGSGPSGTTISISASTASNATNVNGLGGLGIGIDSATAGTVQGNTFTSDPGDGLALYGSSNLTVSGNTSTVSFDGIYIGGPGTSVASSTQNTVSSNKVNSNTNDGIHADADTSMNTFSSNTAKSNINFDFQDASTGTATAGTANTWTGDICHPALDSSPEGLC